ncbi:MAG: thiamine phosphate synthase [Verrucomicrobiota bacterium]
MADRAEICGVINKARLYAILDTGYSQPEDWPRLTEQLILGGVGVIQIRAKNEDPTSILEWAKPVFSLTKASSVPLIINDHPNVAYELECDGCHVGQDDVSLEYVRSILRPWQIVGKSTHSLQQATDAQAEGADYIGFGPIFATPTKPDYTPIGQELIHQLKKQVRLPYFCIGGIKLSNIQGLVEKGVERVVVVSGLLQANDLKATANEFINALPKV